MINEMEGWTGEKKKRQRSTRIIYMLPALDGPGGHGIYQHWYTNWCRIILFLLCVYVDVARRTLALSHWHWTWSLTRSRCFGSHVCLTPLESSFIFLLLSFLFVLFDVNKTGHSVSVQNLQSGTLWKKECHNKRNKVLAFATSYEPFPIVYYMLINAYINRRRYLKYPFERGIFTGFSSDFDLWKLTCHSVTGSYR